MSKRSIAVATNDLMGALSRCQALKIDGGIWISSSFKTKTIRVSSVCEKTGFSFSVPFCGKSTGTRDFFVKVDGEDVMSVIDSAYVRLTFDIEETDKGMFSLGGIVETPEKDMVPENLAFLVDPDVKDKVEYSAEGNDASAMLKALVGCANVSTDVSDKSRNAPEIGIFDHGKNIDIVGMSDKSVMSVPLAIVSRNECVKSFSVRSSLISKFSKIATSDVLFKPDGKFLIRLIKSSVVISSPGSFSFSIPRGGKRPSKCCDMFVTSEDADGMCSVARNDMICELRKFSRAVLEQKKVFPSIVMIEKKKETNVLRFSSDHLISDVSVENKDSSFLTHVNFHGLTRAIQNLPCETLMIHSDGDGHPLQISSAENDGMKCIIIK